MRNVPEEVLAALRERAARHGRSMQQELLLVLKKAAAEAPAPGQHRAIPLITVRAGTRGSWRREEI